MPDAITGLLIIVFVFLSGVLTCNVFNSMVFKTYKEVIESYKRGNDGLRNLCNNYFILYLLEIKKNNNILAGKDMHDGYNEEKARLEETFKDESFK